MELVLTQNPIAKARHRHRRKGNKIITFDPQDKDKKKTKLHLAKQMREKGYFKLSGEALFVNLTNYIEIPRSWPERRRKAAEGQLCTSRPDLDNYLKFYLDVLNDIAYDDDRQVVELWTTKIYSLNPRVEIRFGPSKKMNRLSQPGLLIGCGFGPVKRMMGSRKLIPVIPEWYRLLKKENKPGLQKRKIECLVPEKDDKDDKVKNLYFEVKKPNL